MHRDAAVSAHSLNSKAFRIQLYLGAFIHCTTIDAYGPDHGDQPLPWWKSAPDEGGPFGREVYRQRI